MLNYLPPFMRKSNIYAEIFNAEGEQISLLNTSISDIKAQLDIDTATWGLVIYENELEIKTDLSKPLSDRRSVIKSKWRGSGKVDSIQIKIVADAYTNGDVVVSFNGHIIVQFTSTIGIPPNLEDLKNVLEEIKPAHLRIDYLFRYLLIQDVQTMTIDEIQRHLLNDFAPFQTSIGNATYTSLDGTYSLDGTIDLSGTKGVN